MDSHGNETKEKCKIFQAEVGLVCDGICGEKTRAKLFNKQDEWTFKHFKKSEFTCKCGCGLNNINYNLVQILEDIRNHYNKPLIISSGCRCEKWNAKCGGVSNSRHLIGKASDIYVQNVNKNDLLNYCKNLQNKGVIRYTYTNNTNMKNAVHVDIL